jgi:hypothetical protein
VLCLLEDMEKNTQAVVAAVQAQARILPNITWQ